MPSKFLPNQSTGYNGLTGSPAQWKEGPTTGGETGSGMWVDAQGQQIRDDAIRATAPDVTTTTNAPSVTGLTSSATSGVAGGTSGGEDSTPGGGPPETVGAEGTQMLAGAGGLRPGLGQRIFPQSIQALQARIY